VTTTWSLAYLTPRRRIEFREELVNASDARPIVWISGEGPGVVDLFADADAPSDPHGTEASVLGLAHFHRGETTELLGFVHPHGNWISWLAD
jgi:hypothetical protein